MSCLSTSPSIAAATLDLLPPAISEKTEPPFQFEGPEKKLEIDFRPIQTATGAAACSSSPPLPISSSSNSPGEVGKSVTTDDGVTFKLTGMRQIRANQWKQMLDLVGCKILSEKSNAYMDMYVLSESSLFVYPRHIMIKTCGTTTLLKGVPLLLEFAKSLSLEVEFVMYCRKNFMFPAAQLHPHSSFDCEIDALKQLFNGDAYVLGPLTGEHWNLYIADYSRQDPENEMSQTLEIMMTELDREVMSYFHKAHPSYESAQQTTKDLGLDTLLGTSHTSTTDEFMFDPCGYSLNAFSGNVYYTIHITPEDFQSYVSFETNLRSVKSFDAIIKHVLAVFKPAKFSVSLFTDYAAAAEDYHYSGISPLSFPGFVRTHKTTQEICFSSDQIHLNKK
mmetsp:Transcript_11225/g.16838  ORF Transcript_11225/g.16838 Transcript_11225/m.16838 type:complete len:391 (+) Transcript_11225:201-1373(+)